MTSYITQIDLPTELAVEMARFRQALHDKTTSETRWKAKATLWKHRALRKVTLKLDMINSMAFL